jgi:hypothetical protein
VREYFPRTYPPEMSQDIHYPAWQHMGEYRLVQRVMYDCFALRANLVQTGERGGKLARNQHWIDRQWVGSQNKQAFSFIWCCEILNMDPSYARKAYEKGHVIISVNHSAIL